MDNEKSHYNDSLIPFARNLRNNSTLGEIILWSHVLRAKKMKGYQFNRQYPMKVNELNIIVDFISRKLKLIIEVDGLYHKFKRKQDQYRDQNLSSLGYTVLRIPDNQVRHNLENVVKIIEDKIR
jgi:very-short-patch-repair endonuclease